MKKALKLSLLLLLVLSLASCDWPWEDDDDDVDANAGTGVIVSDSNDNQQPAAATTQAAEATAQAAAATTQAAEAATSSNQGITENGRYVGRTNGNRPTWYFSKTMSRYPSTFKFSDGCSSFTVKNNGHRFTTGGYVIKQSDVPGRGMAALSPASCGSRNAKIVH